MIVFWLVLLIFVWGFLHSLLASTGFKAISGRLFGAGINRWYRLAYNLFAGISLIPVLAAGAFLPDKILYSIPMPWRVLNIFAELLAFTALGIGLLQSRPMEFLGLSQLWETENRQADLNVTGLYHYVRHPLYTAGLIAIWLIPVMTRNIFILDLGITVYILIGATLEERKLRAEFGQAYRDYMAVTPMLIPFMKWNKSVRGTS